jgi:uncharacterized Tic20 family protein
MGENWHCVTCECISLSINTVTTCRPWRPGTLIAVVVLLCVSFGVIWKLRRPESKFLNPKQICCRWWLTYRFIVAFVVFNNGNTGFIFAFTLSFTPRKPKRSATYVDHPWFHPKVEKWQKVVLNYTISVSVCPIITGTLHWILVGYHILQPTPAHLFSHVSRFIIDNQLIWSTELQQSGPWRYRGEEIYSSTLSITSALDLVGG